MLFYSSIEGFKRKIGCQVVGLNCLIILRPKMQKMVPYVLMIAGGLMFIAGIAMLRLRQNATNNLSKFPAKEIISVKDAPVSDENYQRGLAFEKWAVGRFNKKWWRILEWQGDKHSHDGRFAESTTNPDMKLQLTVGEKTTQISLECKWRKGWYRERIEWSYPEQIERYNAYADSGGVQVFVLIGVGGEPENPSEVFLAPLSALKYGIAKQEYLQKFKQEVSGTSRFYYDFETRSLLLKNMKQ